MIRTVLAFVLGVIVMGGAVAGLQALGHLIWPLPVAMMAGWWMRPRATGT
jgi:hypothetical protein